MGKRILILCDAFDAPAYAPRVRYLCENLVKMGWEPFLFTEKLVNVDYQITCCPNVQIPYLVHKGWLGKIEWMLKVLLDDLFDCKSKYYYKCLKPIVKEKKFDVIFCSTFNLFPLGVAYKAANEFHKPLCVDLRDVAEQWVHHEYYAHKMDFLPKKLNLLINNLHKRRIIARRNVCLRKADALTTISPWHVQFLKRINPNVFLIYNGFDESKFCFKLKKQETFDIVYTGRLYDVSLRNPYLLLEAIRLLHENNLLASDFRVRFFIDKLGQSTMKIQFEKYGIQQYLQLNDYIPPQRVPELLQSASIILVLANKTTENGPFGIMTTKFFEALGVEKPILCVRSDESCLADAIRETNAGLAATNVEEVKAFILEKYEEWKRNGYTHQQVNVEKKQLFSRQFQAKQFVQIFEKCL